MTDKPQRACPPLNFIPQRFNPLVLDLTARSLPILLRFRLRRWLPVGIARIETENVEGLVELYRQFQAGKIRFAIAFRHSEVDDPLCMCHLLSRAVPKVARQKGVDLKSPIHSHFIYERGMLLWAGNWLGWYFSRLGGTPIHRGKKLDWLGVRAARDVFANGQLPLAVAPEGATNGHSEIVSPLEPGVAQLGFWCVEDLEKRDRAEEVYIVPIGIRYRYVNPPWKKLDKLFSQLEADCGLPVQRLEKGESSDYAKALYPRLLRLGEHLLSQMEQFYTRVYHISFSTVDSADPNKAIIQRLQTLLDVALSVAERYFNIKGKGSAIDRARRLEEASWHRIYREDIPDLNALSPLERGLADWEAEEADLRMRHMRLAESFVAVTERYVLEKPTAERFAETALILFDFVSRIKGQKPPRRPRLGWRWAQMTVGEPISVRDRAPTYQTSRRQARQAVTDLTQDLQVALEELIN
ncbi:1-acyl-sn-glycerol-3-phosphate acyltransferase [Lusitaniella coriacea]|uniref:1-acyl-sn-glycerol-3-phosphate acyltransferase n=1 Tax=Lusitaniella coriacea TaxID=1983105 RepID=UPI003CEBFA75